MISILQELEEFEVQVTMDSHKRNMNYLEHCGIKLIAEDVDDVKGMVEAVECWVQGVTGESLDMPVMFDHFKCRHTGSTHCGDK